MNKILIGALATVLLGTGTGLIVAGSGLIDVGADTLHSPVVFQALSFARERAIARRLADITAPADLADPERIRRGAGNYDAMCVNCHLAPGLPDSEIRLGLYPAPPNLSDKLPAGRDSRHPARDFWIIKHGIKASGMPAWSKGGMEDKAIWDLAAFLQQLPTLSNAAYLQLVASSDGHSHGGIDQHPHQPTMPQAPSPTPPQPGRDAGKAHDHSTHTH